MYDIKNLNIWKENRNSDIFKCREIVLEDDASKRKESFLGMKCEGIFEEIMRLVPEADIAGIKRRRGGKFRFPIYISAKMNSADLEVLELSMRSSNCLHRAGFMTVGELVEQIDGSDDLKKIRNCGVKSINEIMESLFCYQYSQLPTEKKSEYIHKVIGLNNGCCMEGE